MIPFWNTEFTEAEVISVSNAIRNRKISQGELTELLEKEISELLGIKHVAMVTSGSMALTLAMMVFEIGLGDEVIIPDRTWIATAHAVINAGATPIVVDTEKDRPVMSIESMEKAISRKTKAIIPVHMNGRGVDMEQLNRIAKANNIKVVEDAAQAFMSRHKGKYLGTYGDVGCFSLSMAKLISTGQGGFLVTNSDDLNTKIRRMRTHGVSSTFEPERWNMRGGNFRYTDLQAAIGLEQIARINEKKEKCIELYLTYIQELNQLESQITPIKVEHSKGEIPIYNEFSCDSRENLINYLKKHGIETRPFYPAISTATYIHGEKNTREERINSGKFSKTGIYMPSGPDMSLKNAIYVTKTIKKYYQQ